jgi:hypothetical protein
MMQVLSIVRLGGDEAFAERRENISILEQAFSRRIGAKCDDEQSMGNCFRFAWKPIYFRCQQLLHPEGDHRRHFPHDCRTGCGRARDLGGVSVSAPFSVAVASTAPSFFSLNGTGAGQIAAVNAADGSINDAAHSVAVGGYISLFATGEGITTPAGTDGALAATTPFPHPVAPVQLTIGGVNVTPGVCGCGA